MKGGPMSEEIINVAELKLSDRLAVERTIMGADRTLLAWVRTSLSLVSFGFTLFKVLEALQQTAAGRVLREHTPRNIGIFLILVGMVPLMLAMYQYHGTIRRLGGKGNVYINPGMLAGTAILFLGFALLATAVLRLELF
jgi:putative membrane protein